MSSYTTNYNLEKPCADDKPRFFRGTYNSNLDIIDAKLKEIFDCVGTNSAWAHNSIYRGKDLGTSVTQAQWSSINAGTFDDMYIGDYWTINSKVWRIASFNYWLGVMNSKEVCTQNHIVIVPDSILTTAKMNNSDQTTQGYGGSDFSQGKNGNTGKATAETAVNNAFGQEHILSHPTFVRFTYTYPATYLGTVDLMTERMVYGSGACGLTDGLDVGVDRTQLPLFFYNPSLIRVIGFYWLRDKASETDFACVDNRGCASTDNASMSRGIRPAFAIYQADS